MSKPVNFGKGDELILISLNQSQVTPLCQHPPLLKEQMLRKRQWHLCEGGKDCDSTVFSGMILVFQGKLVKKYFSSKFSLKESLLLVSQDFSQTSYKIMREQMGREEYEAFLFLALTFVFMSKQVCSGADEDPDDKNAPFRQRPFCKYKGHTADLLDLSWSKVRNSYLNCVFILA